MCRSSQALVVGNQPGTIPANITVAPADNPGWNNFSTAGSYVYLGDGWGAFGTTRRLRQWHGIPDAHGNRHGSTHPWPVLHRLLRFPHDDGIHYYAISNPTTVQPEAGSPITLSPYTDLQLFRVHADREIDLPSLKIATEPLPNNFGLNNAPQVLGSWGVRALIAAESSWSVTGTSPNFTWTTPPSGSTDHRGYVDRWHFHTALGNQSDFRSGRYSNLFSGVVSNTTGVFQLHRAWVQNHATCSA